MRFHKAGCALIMVSALAGCRQELAELSFLLDDGETLQVTRGVLASGLLVQGGGTAGVAMGACIQAPTAWGSPAVTAQGTRGDGATPVSLSPPDVDIDTAAYAQVMVPRTDYAWYCHEYAQQSYGPDDTGEVTWTFPVAPADAGSALVITSLGYDDQLSNVAFHQVRRGTRHMTGEWQAQPVLLAGDTPAPLQVEPSWVLPGSFDGQALIMRQLIGELTEVAADGTVTVNSMSFTPLFFNKPRNGVLVSPNLLVAFESTDSNTTITPRFSTDGKNWTGAADSLPGASLLFAGYNAGLGQFVAAVQGDSRLFYSADGIDWSTTRDTDGIGAVYTDAYYASLADGTEAFKAVNADFDEVLYARTPEGSFVQALTRPEGGSTEWRLIAVTTVGDQFFATTLDGQAFTLFTSNDGVDWRQISQEAPVQASVPPLGAALGDWMLVSFNGRLWVSNSAGATFALKDVSELADFLGNWTVSLDRVWRAGNRVFLEMDLVESGQGSNATVLLSTADGETFTVEPTQGEGSSVAPYAYTGMVAGEQVIQVGEDADGFRVYTRVAARSGNRGVVASSSGGGGVGFLSVALLVLLGVRRRR